MLCLITFLQKDYSHESVINTKPVINHYKVVTCKYACISKAEDAKQVAKEALVENKSKYDQMKSTVKAYDTKKEFSLQEAIYLLMPELQLCKIFPRVIFLNSNFPEKHSRMFKKKVGTDELPKKKLNIYIYISQYQVIDQIYFAKFLSLSIDLKPSESTENECQLVVSNDEIREINHQKSRFPETIPLIPKKVKLK